jgi:hypothetical protein
MFEQVLFTKKITHNVPPIDIGALAEALLFYQQVSIVGERVVLKELFSAIPTAIFLRLLEDKRIQLHIPQVSFGINSQMNPGHPSVHHVIGLAAQPDTVDRGTRRLFEAAAGGDGRAKISGAKFAKALQAMAAPNINFTEAMFSPSIETMVLKALKVLAPDAPMPTDPHFRVEPVNASGFTVGTNLDFTLINEVFHRTVSPAHTVINEAYLLALILHAHEVSHSAASLQCEVAVGPLEREIQAATLESLVEKRRAGEQKVHAFASLTLDSGTAIRDAINSGKISFAELLRLLDKADKFRHWLRDQPVDSDLLRNYYRASVEETFAERLPAKILRWAVYTGAGMAVDAQGTGGIGTAAGLGLSFYEAFLLDKLVGGWKPHQFVESELRPALRSE